MKTGFAEEAQAQKTLKVNTGSFDAQPKVGVVAPEQVSPEVLSERSTSLSHSIIDRTPLGKSIAKKMAADHFLSKDELVKLSPTEQRQAREVTDYLLQLQRKTGIAPAPGQSVDDYVSRAVAEQVKKTPNITMKDLVTKHGNDGITSGTAQESSVSTPVTPRESVATPPDTTETARSVRSDAELKPEAKVARPVEDTPQVKRPGVAATPERATTPVDAHTREIAEKWKAIAATGPTKNPHWGEVRDLTVAEVSGAKIISPEAGSVDAAKVEMQRLIARAHASGFRPDPGEHAGAYLERIAKTMETPLSDKELVDRATTMWNELGKHITLRGNIANRLTANDFVNGKLPPGMDSTAGGKEFLQVQNVLRRIHDRTGVEAVPGEDVRAYAERAIRVQLKRTPTLNADMLMETPRPVPPPQVPAAPPAQPKAQLRWDQQA